MSFPLPKPPKARCDKVLRILGDGPASVSQLVRRMRITEREVRHVLFELEEYQCAVMVTRNGVVSLARAYATATGLPMQVIDGGLSGPRPQIRARRIYGPLPSPLDDLDHLLDAMDGPDAA